MTTRNTPLRGLSYRSPAQPPVEEYSIAAVSTPRASIKLSTTPEGTPFLLLPSLVPEQGSDNKRDEVLTLFKRTQARARSLPFQTAQDPHQLEYPAGGDLPQQENPVTEEPLRRETPTTGTPADAPDRAKNLVDNLLGEP